MQAFFLGAISSDEAKASAAYKTRKTILQVGSLIQLFYLANAGLTLVLAN